MKDASCVVLHVFIGKLSSFRASLSLTKLSKCPLVLRPALSPRRLERPDRATDLASILIGGIIIRINGWSGEVPEVYNF